MGWNPFVSIYSYSGGFFILKYVISKIDLTFCPPINLYKQWADSIQTTKPLQTEAQLESDCFNHVATPSGEQIQKAKR